MHKEIIQLITRNAGMLTWSRLRRYLPYADPARLTAALDDLEREGRLVILVGRLDAVKQHEPFYTLPSYLEAIR